MIGFREQGENEPVLIVNLANAFPLAPIKISLVPDVPSVKGSELHITNSLRTYVLKADSEAEIQKWYEAVKLIASAPSSPTGTIRDVGKAPSPKIPIKGSRTGSSQFTRSAVFAPFDPALTPPELVADAMASSGASPSQVSPIPAPAVNAATEQLEELRRRLQAVEAENEELRRQVRQWPPPDPKVAEELRQKEAELRAVQAAAEQARKQLAEANERLAQTNQQLKELQSQTVPDAGAFAEKEKRIGELEAEIAQLKRQLMDTKLQAATMTRELNETKKSLDSLRKNPSASPSMREVDPRNTLQLINQHREELRRQFEAEAKLTSDDGDAEPRSIAELQMQLKRAEAQVEAYRNQLEMERSATQSLSAHLAELKTKVEDQENQLQRLRNSNLTYQAEIDQLNHKLAVKERKEIELKNELRRLGGTEPTFKPTAPNPRASREMARAAAASASTSKQDSETSVSLTEPLLEDPPRRDDEVEEKKCRWWNPATWCC